MRYAWGLGAARAAAHDGRHRYPRYNFSVILPLYAHDVFIAAPDYSALTVAMGVGALTVGWSSPRGGDRAIGCWCSSVSPSAC